MTDARLERVKELSGAVQADPSSIARRLELAAALHQLGRHADAIDLYLGVATAYADEGRYAQAIVVCRGTLEVDPGHRPTVDLLESIAGKRSARERRPANAAPQWGDFSESAGQVEEDTPLPLPPSPAVTDLISIDFDDGANTRLGYPSPPASADPDDSDRTAIRVATAQVVDLRGGAFDPRVTPATNPMGRPIGARAMPRSDEGAADSSQGRDTDPDVRELADEDRAQLAAALRVPWPSPDPANPPPPFPLLGDLPRAAFLELVARLRVRREPAGVLLLKEGEPGDACYLISSGSVRVQKAGVELARLGAGSFFGEFAVLSDQRRHASVEVVEAVELLEISRQLVDELTAAHPGVARTLRRFYSQRLMETLIATAPFFAPLSAVQREEVSGRFRPRRFGRAAEIIAEGQPGAGLYLILVGEVEVVHREGEVELPLAVLGEGSYFGEMSLLKGGVASATVRATRTTEVVQLPPRDFYEVVSSHPVLWESLRVEAARRELLNHALLVGEARLSGDGTTYLL